MIVRASLLAHPNIPKPLHGIAPRAIKGQEWWDSIREGVYALYKYRCSACGIHRDAAPYYQWLEAHECYNIDYDTGRVTLREIVGLCHACHNFIHSGRMTALVGKGEMSPTKAIEILERGFVRLKRAGFLPNPVAARLWCLLKKGMDDKQAQVYLAQNGLKWVKPEPWENIPWNEWHLLFEGEKYYSKFENIAAWAAHYGGTDDDE